MPNRCTVTLRSTTDTASVLELLRRERFLDNNLSRPAEIYVSPRPRAELVDCVRVYPA